MLILDLSKGLSILLSWWLQAPTMDGTKNTNKDRTYLALRGRILTDFWINLKLSYLQFLNWGDSKRVLHVL